MKKPVPAALEIDSQTQNGDILKLTMQGFLMELDAVKFKVGSFGTVTFQILDENITVIERVRSIKHYDKFFRKTPSKNKETNNLSPEPSPRKLVEMHFAKLSEQNRRNIHKFLTKLTVESLKRAPSR